MRDQPCVCVFAPAPLLTVTIERPSTGRGDGEVHPHPGEDLVPGTDAAALAVCTASVTSLHAVCEEVEAGLPDTFDLDIH